jgi:hypothetical protein
MIHCQYLKAVSKKLITFSKNLLTTAILCSMFGIRGLLMTIRETIQKELKRKGWSHYRLVQELEGKMPARTVYAYLSGKCDLVSDRVSIMLQVLDLQIKLKPKKGQGPRR